MALSLADRIGIGDHELVSIVGAGGKSTILFLLGRELAIPTGRVILTTTTKMAADQITEPTCWSDDPTEVESMLEPGRPLFVVTGEVPGKATGPTAEATDRLFLETAADHLIVEADGARSMSIKAPADHEPVITDLSTTVVVVVGIDAIGRPISKVAFRPDLVAKIAGVGEHDSLTTANAADVLLAPNGGLKNIPETARVVMALTKVTPETEESATELAAILNAHPRVDRVVTLAGRPVEQ
ncbi:MAG: selenium cofactor biosynthesis protein YqeC [Actinomycetia bacterium]|nr:selenium cofactor biosynthesis protein YqeC [Actinomycetes bacterium]